MLVELKENIRQTMLYLLVTNRVIRENKKAHYLCLLGYLEPMITFFLTWMVWPKLEQQAYIFGHLQISPDVSHPLTKYWLVMWNMLGAHQRRQAPMKPAGFPKAWPGRLRTLANHRAYKRLSGPIGFRRPIKFRLCRPRVFAGVACLSLAYGLCRATSGPARLGR